MVKKIKKKKVEEDDMGLEEEYAGEGYHKDYYEFLEVKIGNNIDALASLIPEDVIQVIPPDPELSCWEIHMEDFISYLTTMPVLLKVKARTEEEPKKRKLHVASITKEPEPEPELKEGA